MPEIAQQQLTTAWASIQGGDMLWEVADALEVGLGPLRRALMQAHGVQTFRQQIIANRQARPMAGVERMAGRLVEQEGVTAEQLDAAIITLEDAILTLEEAKEDL
jgi:hypothetical protein